IPYFNINLGFAGVETMPADSEARHAFTILDEEFSSGNLAPVQFVIEGDPEEVTPAIEQLRVEIAEMTIPNGDSTEPAFLPIPEGEWAVWNEDGDVALMEATLT